MTGIVLRKIAVAVALVWAVVTLAFAINNVVPSDPARMVAGPQARPRDVERIREQLGLDQPVLEQYARFMRRLIHIAPDEPAPPMGTDAKPSQEHATCATFGPIHADLGRSYQRRQPVVKLLAERVPRTAMLALAAVALQSLLGVVTGTIAAARKRRALDYAVVTTTIVGISAPTFLLGLLLQFVFAHKLRLLPLDGFGKTPSEHAVSLVLPALTLGIFGAAYYTRLTRDEMIHLLAQDFVRTARAKGLSGFGVVVKHALRNVLLPLVTVIGLDLGALFGGAIVTETLFRWPGLGELSMRAIVDRDGPVIMGAVLVSATAIVFFNLVVDLLYVALDPTVRK
jgi:peptide/nickel transport system permease protein